MIDTEVDDNAGLLHSTTFIHAVALTVEISVTWLMQSTSRARPGYLAAPVL